MAVSLLSGTVSGVANAGNPATTCSIAPPTGLQSGELWVIVAIADADNASSNAALTISGFTNVAATLFDATGKYPVARACWKVAGASEGNATIAINTGFYDIVYASMRFSGANATPIDGSQQSTTSASSGSTLAQPSISVSSAGSMAISFAGQSEAPTSIAQPGGMTSIINRAGGGIYPAGGIAYQAVNAGTFSPGNWTFNAGNTGQLAGVFVIAPSGGGGSSTDLTMADVVNAHALSNMPLGWPNNLRWSPR